MVILVGGKNVVQNISIEDTSHVVSEVLSSTPDINHFSFTIPYGWSCDGITGRTFL